VASASVLFVSGCPDETRDKIHHSEMSVVGEGLALTKRGRIKRRPHG
jgi:hypothetical protein